MIIKDMQSKIMWFVFQFYKGQGKIALIAHWESKEFWKLGVAYNC